MKFSAWLWPDHVIYKCESRRLREEHNAVLNEREELIDAAKLVVSRWEHGNLASAVRKLNELIDRIGG